MSFARSLCLEEASWAAWAQAGITGVALVVTFYVASHQTRVSLAQHRSQASNQLDGLSRVLIALQDAVRELGSSDAIFQRACDPQRVTAAFSRFEEYAEAIRRMPLEQLPGEVAVAAVVDTRLAVAQLMPFVNGSVATIDLEDDQDDIRAVNDCLDALQQQVNLLRIEAQRVLGGRGPSHAAAAAAREPEAARSPRRG